MSLVMHRAAKGRLSCRTDEAVAKIVQGGDLGL
jgi:hypothetical protein